MRVKAAQDRMVRHPLPPYAYIAEAGENVDDSPYWRKRLVRGDVVLVEDPPIEAPKRRRDAQPAEEK